MKRFFQHIYIKIFLNLLPSLDGGKVKFLMEQLVKKIDENEAIKNSYQKVFIDVLTSHLFNTITKDDVLQIRKQGVFLNNRQLDVTDIEAIKEDAVKFSKSTIWKLLSNEVKFASNQRMYERGKTDDDILAGKMALYTLEVIEKTMDEISKL